MDNAVSLLSRFRARDSRALAQLASACEDREEWVIPVLRELYASTGHARVFGVTGAPGAGKSTLTSLITGLLRAQGRTVGVLAVDPVSPFSGGSLLGDRIRMSAHFNDPGVFIRSVSTRGQLGGLSVASLEITHLLDSFGFDDILVETVGVGQSEVEIRAIVDLTVVVLVPDWGDGVQAIKAGILEIGDVFAIHKADREGADRVEADLRLALQLAGRPALIVKTRADSPASVQALLEAVESEMGRLGTSRTRERRLAGSPARALVERAVLGEARGWVDARAGEGSNPYALFEEFRRKHPAGTLFRE